MTTRSTRTPRRRTVVALGVVLAIVIAFVVRLVDIQVVNADANIAQSLSMGIGVSKPIDGTRGSIVDENGTVLADSILTYDAQLDPSTVGPVKRIGADGTTTTVDWPTAAGQIGAITGQNPDDIQKLVSDALAKDPGSQYAPLATGLSTAKYVALKNLNLPFLAFRANPARAYPAGAVAGNLVGFVGSDGNPLAGLEDAQNQCLSPTAGSVTYEQGMDGNIIPGTETEKPAVDGGTLKLTINSDLQWYLQQLVAQSVQDMGANYGTITVVEVKTGKIRAAAEYPTVDPNNINAPGSYLYSRIFNSTFEPGSTFKAITASTLIDAAGQSPTSTAEVPAAKSFDNGARVIDADMHPTENYTLAGVLINSSNVGASVFSERVSPQTRYDYLQRFGIGSGSAVNFLGEAKGLVYPPDQWNNQMLYDTSYGQGLTTTIPELMDAYVGIVNNGQKVPLSLVESCTHPDGTVDTPPAPATTQVVSPDTSAQMREILENVALQGSVADQVKIPGYRIGLKTGTGQKTDGNGHYKSDVYYTSLIGFAPADDPQYLVAVTLDEPTAVRSSAANAPAFQKAMTQVLKTFRVPPSTTQPVVLPQTG
ncbi:penicillin-binding protein 2 [Microbacterium sp. SORGH_AS_0888]|uniref:peptidoglycan D,D-transpeptidase FtsI family protein n=1 Tax=Microbacterium sp. SORGH_AS_0888 TaxID=3041791 RepID=UPI00277DBB1D|nr:penicillin-binding protein 2 [Microbacterium sp. SORGH_AS_0888]MDQ1128886.1 cell division protein FtsI (penicillin-binding protein 3) [Microbacterium sp. SORGH_AS_0888]